MVLTHNLEKCLEQECTGGKEAAPMISFAVRLKFAPEDRADVGESLLLLAAASRREPGCVSYIPHRSEDDVDLVVIYEQYQDAQALAAHRESEHFKKHAVGGLYQKMRERSVENLIALV
jgi:quinol monooxygenase YgiN